MCLIALLRTVSRGEGDLCVFGNLWQKTFADFEKRGGIGQVLL